MVRLSRLVAVALVWNAGCGPLPPVDVGGSSSSGRGDEETTNEGPVTGGSSTIPEDVTGAPDTTLPTTTTTMTTVTTVSTASTDPGESDTSTSKPDTSTGIDTEDPVLCGDGVVGGDEECDDGINGDNDDGCTDGCQFPRCGDGIVQASLGEGCDEQTLADDGACTLACQPAVCGDGLVWSIHEACDDADAVNDDECTNNCGIPCPGCPIVLFVNASFRGRFDGSGWTNEFNVDGSQDPDVVITAARVGISVFIGGDDLGYTLYRDDGWTEQLALGGKPPAAEPTICASGVGAHVGYQAEDSMYYYAGWDGEMWAPTAEPIGSAGPMPSRGAIGDVGGDPVFVFVDEGGRLQSRARVGGVWQAPVQLHPAAYPVRPRMVAFDVGAELLVVHRDRYSVRVAGEWAPMKQIPGAVVPERFNVTALPGGRALLVWTASDDMMTRQTMYDAASDTWSPVTLFYAFFATFDAPAIAPGVGGAELEVIRTTSGLVHDRRFDGVFMGGSTIATLGAASPAVASAP